MSIRGVPPRHVERRALLVGACAVAFGIVAGCTDDRSGDPQASGSTPGSDRSPSEPGVTTTSRFEVAALGPDAFDRLGACVLVPEMMAGPFPTIEQLDRRDITEGYPGRALRLGLRIVDAGCAPVSDASVEIWHADASGDYSSYVDGGTGKDEGEGTTFLRGTQSCDRDGIVEFHTIYPGWYPGRAVHVHVRVWRDREAVFTGQLFFPDDLTAAVFAADPYAPFGSPDTTNATDGLGGDIERNGSLLHIAPGVPAEGQAITALLNLAIA